MRSLYGTYIIYEFGRGPHNTIWRAAGCVSIICSTLLESASKSGGTGIHWKPVSFSSVLIINLAKAKHDSIKKTTQALLVANTEADLEEKAEKTKCFVMSRE